MDAGSISILLALLFAGAVLLAGLLADASRVLAANADASDLAGKAARAGAQEIDLTTLRTEPDTGTGIALDEAKAATTARAYLDRHGIEGTVIAAENTVTVTVHVHITYTLLALSGTDGETVTQTRSAAATRGP